MDQSYIEIYSGLDDRSSDRLVKGLPVNVRAFGLRIFEMCLMLRDSIIKPQLGHTYVSH